ncbi:MULTISPECIES: L,D-transpeptidase family protein [unclassified Halomonas]|uniref:L,D-transpeptidase family protein n=1 Tax=unclassified Halomonas TaxID=2609666 RepID=UPI001CF3B26B|nr:MULTISPECIES: L,D-transpeptidase family protein [unclassified Halomonas]MCA8863890.1 L,D-transpeptidase family protein [Halomonas sp. SBBP1]UZH11135.1 L,D-transpeptidase family protein [Halomonas sp. BDJS001]
MNDIQPLRQWAIGVALCLTLTHSPLGTSQAYADSVPLQQALTQQLSKMDAYRLPITEFYQLRDGQPAWQTARAVESLVAALNSLEADGLTPDDYHADTLLDEFQRSQAEGEAAQATFDIKATRSLLLALDHLERGKVNPREIEPQWDTPRPERGYSLLRVVHAVDDRVIDNAIALARPSSPEYQQLRDALKQHYQLVNLGSVPYLAARDESLRPGDEDDDVSVLRQRLALWGEADLQVADSRAYPMIGVQTASNRRTYDAPLEAAVRRFQRRHLLQEDGVVGEQTRLALNTSVASRIDQLRVNLERARWISPMQSAEPRVWVDIAGYRMHYVRPNGQHWDARVVVGTPRRETPIIHSTISHLTINPSWTIPPTIMREDVLPQVRADIDYLARKNIQVISPMGEPLVADEVDWQHPGGVMLRQVAGTGNPLGRVVVRFPNDDMIYLHDTPARGLFQRDQRALSSGCIRVEGVAELAQMLLQDTGSRYQMSSLLNGGSDRNVNLTQRIPIALHYLTAWPNAEGEVEFRPDIYRRDATLLAALRRPV